MVRTALVVLLAAGAVLVGVLAFDGGRSSSTISAREVRQDISSRAEWFASFPRTTAAQIQMACDISPAAARRYDRRLGPEFSAGTLRQFRADCLG